MAAQAVCRGIFCRPPEVTHRTTSALILALGACVLTAGQAHAQCAPAGPYNNGADTVVCAPGAGENIDTLGGADRVTVNGGNVTSIIEGTGTDRLTVNDGTVGSADQGSDNDTAVINGGTITGTLDQGSGQDIYRQTGGNVGTLDQGTSGDRATINAGSVIGTIQQGSGSDRLVINGGTITQIDQGSFGDRLIIRDGIIGTVTTGTGDDTTTISAGTVTGAFQQNDGRDRFTMSGGTIDSLDQGGDFDRATITGGRITGLFEDGDNVRFSGGQIGAINLTAADNVFRISGTAMVDTFVNSEQGNDRYFLQGGTIGTFINTGSGNDRLVLDGTAVGTTIDFETGDDRLTLTSGSAGGDIMMGAGSDRATINSTFSAAGLGGTLDGGDDLLLADGDNDILTFSNWTGSLPGAKLLNWERVTIDGGQVSFSDDMLVTGQEVRGNGRARTGLTVTNGGQLDMGSSFVLTGNATLINGGGIVAATPGGIGNFLIDGNFDNQGTLDFSGGSPAAGDRLTVQGDYRGGGTIHFDSNLDATRATDRMIINGRVRTPGTIVTVNDTGTGIGAPTGDGPGDGIKIVDVSNTGDTADGDFVLNGELKTGGISGAYVYNLFRESDGNWYLQSVYIPDPAQPKPTTKPTQGTSQGPAAPSQPRPKLVAMFAPSVPTYEAYPHLLLGLGGVPTYRQRIGQRHRAGGTGPDAALPCDDPMRENPCGNVASDIDGNQVGGATGNATWARVSVGRRHSEQATSTSMVDLASDSWKLDGGVDVTFADISNLGRLIGGLTVHYGGARADVASPFGDGEINARGGGVGLTGTFVGAEGFYLDAQGRATWSTADLGADLLGALEKDNRGFGYGLGLEVGQRLDLMKAVSITPQGQLTFKSIDFNAFTDRFNGTVSLLDGDSLAGRLGVLIDTQSQWREADGSRSHKKLYAIANVEFEFLDATKVDVSGVEFHSSAEKLWGEIAVGGSISLSDDAVSIFGEIGGKTGLRNFGDSFGVTGKAGLRIKY
ncbi:MAG: autotransporter outer membrane beta-barrel domain-containing protein [Alphaproteobacteria bacterium]|nr:autotransporter outer membrane beta-barrel domain-containing protein [Alphaproteobacteria bacterium]